MDCHLKIFAEQFSRWGNVTNLTSHRDKSHLWARHIHDSLQLLNLAPTAKRWLDIGSGAGFPGLVIAAQLYGRPGAEVHCVESDKRKCAFLAHVVRQTGIPAIIHSLRIERLDYNSIHSIEAVTARAITSLPALLELTKDYLDQGTVGLFPSGRDAEIPPKNHNWTRSYTFEKLASTTDPGSRIVRVHKNMV
jgi:16S rRNA (guanine527-N7)-methyltransferase